MMEWVTFGIGMFFGAYMGAKATAMWHIKQLEKRVPKVDQFDLPKLSPIPLTYGTRWTK